MKVRLSPVTWLLLSLALFLFVAWLVLPGEKEVVWV